MPDICVQPRVPMNICSPTFCILKRQVQVSKFFLTFPRIKARCLHRPSNYITGFIGTELSWELEASRTDPGTQRGCIGYLSGEPNQPGLVALRIQRGFRVQSARQGVQCEAQVYSVQSAHL